MIEGKIPTPEVVKPIESRFCVQVEGCGSTNAESEGSMGANGYSHTAGLNYGDIFAPTGKILLFCVLL